MYLNATWGELSKTRANVIGIELPNISLGLNRALAAQVFGL